MSKYTTQVRFICETSAGLTENAGYGSVNEIIQRAIPKVFDFEFPIYDESYRNVLCTKILKHYYTREIGAETVGLWKLWLDTRLNEIMPYYNQLYKSAVIEFNPMYDIDLNTEYLKSNDGNNNTTENSTENSSGNNNELVETEGENVGRTLFSDTPQGALDNVENQTYLTNATKETNEGSNLSNKDYEYSGNRVVDKTGMVTIKNTEEYIQHITGKTGGVSYSKRLNEFRSTFINIDTMIIDELKDLFFNLW